MINGEGRYEVFKKEGFHYAGGYIKKGVYRSVPFAVLIQDSEGNNLLKEEGEEIGSKIIFDNSDNYIFIKENYPPKRSECTDCTLDFSQISLALFSRKLCVRGVEFSGKKTPELVQKYG